MAAREPEGAFFHSQTGPAPEGIITVHSFVDFRSLYISTHAVYLSNGKFSCKLYAIYFKTTLRQKKKHKYV